MTFVWKSRVTELHQPTNSAISAAHTLSLRRLLCCLCLLLSSPIPNRPPRAGLLPLFSGDLSPLAGNPVVNPSVALRGFLRQSSPSLVALAYLGRNVVSLLPFVGTSHSLAHASVWRHRHCTRLANLCRAPVYLPYLSYTRAQGKRLKEGTFFLVHLSVAKPPYPHSPEFYDHLSGQYRPAASSNLACCLPCRTRSIFRRALACSS